MILPRDSDVDCDGWNDCRPEEGGEEHLVAEHQHDGREETALQRKHALSISRNLAYILDRELHVL